MENEADENILLRECRSAIELMKFLGVVLIRIDTAGKFNFKNLLVPVCYMLLIYSLSMYVTFKQMIRRTLIIASARCNFDCIIFSLSTIYVLGPEILIPVAFWLNMKRILVFWDDWYKFQIQFKELAGRSLKIKSKTFITSFVWGSMIEVMLTTTVSSIFLAAKFNFVATSTYYVVFGNFIACVAYWLAVCTILKRAADDVLTHTIKTFSPWSAQHKDITSCYKLWLSLRVSIKSFGRSMESFLLVYGFSLTLMMLNSLYGFVSQLYTTELKSSNIKQAVGHGVLCLWSSRLMLILNDSSYRVVDVINYKWKQQILSMNLNKKSSFSKVEITEFYQIFRNNDNSQLSMFGFSTFSREFFIMILSAIITYMIILLQIRNDYLSSSKLALATGNRSCPHVN